MKTLALLAALLLTSTVSATKPDAPLHAYAEFRYACNYALFFYGVACGDLEAPVVVTSRVVSAAYYGFTYRSEPYVFVNKRLWLHDESKWRSTVVHETMHYILDKRSPGQFSRCESERAARNAHHSFEGTKYDGSWEKQYRC